MRITGLVLLALLNAVNAGVFLAFTSLVSRALRDAPGQSGVGVMLRINERAPRSVFMVFFLGAPLAAVAVGVLGIAAKTLNPVTGGAVAATLAAFVVSVGWNIPWNNRLDRDRGASWGAYSRDWPRANAVRGLLSLVAAALAQVAALMR